MLRVAVLGADGAGKSTVTARLVADLPYTVRRMYLGVGAESATHALPTTRAVRRVRAAMGHSASRPGPPPIRPIPRTNSSIPNGAPLPVRWAKGVGAAGRMANRMTEEAYQEAISRWHLSCGRIVIYDRYYLADFHAHDLAGHPDLPRSRRVHAAFLRRCFVEPDLVVVLDADPAILYARKGEGTIDELARRRHEYLDYASTVRNAVLIDATKPLEAVVAEVTRAIDEAVRRASGPVVVDPEVGGPPTETDPRFPSAVK